MLGMDVEDRADLGDGGIEIFKDPASKFVQHVMVVWVVALANHNDGLGESIRPKDLTHGADGDGSGAKKAGEDEVGALDVEAVSGDCAFSVEETIDGE